MPIRMTGLNSGLDTEALVSDLMSAQRMKLTKIENKQTKLTWKQEKWKDLNKKIYSLYTDHLSKLRLEGTYMTKKVKSSNDNKATVTGDPTAVDGTQTLEVKQLASSQFVTGTELAKVDDKEVTASTKLSDLGFAEGDTITLKVGDETTEFKIEEGTTLNDFMKAAKDAGLNANFDKNRLFLSSKESGKENSFEITTDSAAGMEALGLGAGAVKKDAQDAIYRLNGMEFESSSNTVNVNGLTIQMTGTTDGYDDPDPSARECIALTVTTDVDAVYDTVKDFVKSYNELLKEMNDLFHAKSARGYEPLTDEEKDAMSDEQIEKWEGKIKDSLLRNDNSLGGLLNAMKSSLGRGVNIDGETYSLTTFGIATSKDYTEKGLLHIYGDEEDSTYGNKDDKLKKALTDDPENTIKALTEIFGGLYEEMSEKMKATDLRSAMTFYNDKELAKMEAQYKKEYSTMEDRLQKIEDQYYKQFSAMEQAMAKLNSQQSALGGLFGGFQ